MSKPYRTYVHVHVCVCVCVWVYVYLRCVCGCVYYIFDKVREKGSAKLLKFNP